jgi:hypothetical protein
MNNLTSVSDKDAMIYFYLGQWVMGEAKRRKAALGDKYGKEARMFPWLPFTKSQGQQFVKWTTTGAWYGITLMVVAWLTIRFVGPAFGWWKVH